jgi:hypothetical protein
VIVAPLFFGTQCAIARVGGADVLDAGVNVVAAQHQRVEPFQP